MLRTVVFWVHLCVGITISLVILMMSVTGILLTYESQINKWDLREFRSSPSVDTSTALPLDTILSSVTEFDHTLEVSAIRIRSDAYEPAAINVGSGLLLFVDQYSGEVIGNNDRPIRQFLRTIMYWHRWFALEDDNRTIGRAITGASNLGFLFLLLSGFYLWLPKNYARKTLRRIVWFQAGLQGKAKDFNWHNVIGIWTVLPLLIIVISGSVISYRWASDTVYLLVGETPPSRTASSDTVTAEQPTLTIDATQNPVSYQQIFDRAAEDAVNWRTITIRIPQDDANQVVALVDRGSGRQPSKQFELVFNQNTGELVERAGYPTYRQGRKIRRWLRFAHTGEVFGLPGQTLAGIVTLGTTILIWTGLAMAWRRFIKTIGKEGRRN